MLARAGLGESEPATASYIADMTVELARLARSAELGVLAYLLEMAATEARGSVLGDSPYDDDEISRLD
jgi:hypothetical protein